MSTWHQRRFTHRLYHATQWTVVEDRANETMTVTRYPTKAEAEAYRQRVGSSAYILPPQP